MFKKLSTALVLLTFSNLASANMISLDSASYSGIQGEQINVDINYDFTDFAMFGGGFNLNYDTGILAFVSYTQADYSGTDIEAAASPIGGLSGAGDYQGAGIGTFDFLSGSNSAGLVGTFVFNLLSDIGVGGTTCGSALCLTPNGFNPMVSLVGQVVDTEVFAAGISAANVDVRSAVVGVPETGTLALLGLGIAGVALTRRRQKV